MIFANNLKVSVSEIGDKWILCNPDAFLAYKSLICNRYESMAGWRFSD